MSRGRNNRRKELKRKDQEYRERLMADIRAGNPVPTHVVLPSGKLLQLRPEVRDRIMQGEMRDGSKVMIHHREGIE